MTDARRGAFLIAVLVVATLTITATPATAANKALVVETKFTTDSDFNQAKTLDNVDVRGTGDGATVNFTSVARSGSTLTLESEESLRLTSNNLGIAFEPKSYLDGVSVTAMQNMDFDTIEIKDSGGSLLKTVDVGPTTGGDTVTVKYDFEKGNEYVLTVAENGDTYPTVGENSNASFPYSNSDIEVTAGYSDGKTQSVLFAFQDITPVFDNPDKGTYLGANHTVNQAEQAKLNLSLSNTEAIVTVNGVDGGDTQLAQQTFTSGGEKTLSWSPYSGDKIEVNVTFSETGTDGTGELQDVSILRERDGPEFDNSSASPNNTNITDKDVTFEINVSDAGFPNGDSVDVEFYLDGDKIGTDTLTNNGTASVSTTVTEGGDHSWYAVATDSYGIQATSDTFTFSLPAQITVYNESDPDQIINNTNVTVTIFGQGETVVDRKTQDGEISLTGLPADETYILQLDAANYTSRTVVLDGFFGQQEVYMLPENATTVDSRFRLTDKTGEFPNSNSFLRIQRPLNISGNTSYKTVAGDAFGPAGVTTTLETDQRYRLIVENGDGDTRVVGSYTPVTSETVELVIGEIDYDLTQGNTYEWDATFVNDSQGTRIVFQLNDPNNATDDVRVVIYQRGDPQHEILNGTFDGPYGSLTVTEMLNDSQANKTWVVQFESTRNESSESGQKIVGETVAGVAIPLSDVHKFGLSVGAILVVAALGANIDPGVGAVITSLMAGLFVYLEWLPPEVGLAAVALALVVSAIWIIRYRGGP